MHSKQGWTEVTEEGVKREIRAFRRGPNWSIRSKVRGDEEWTLHDPPSEHDLENLLDLLQRKYRRNRASLTDVENVQKLLEKARNRS